MQTYPHPLAGKLHTLSLEQADPNGLVRDGQEVEVLGWLEHTLNLRQEDEAEYTRQLRWYSTRSLFSGFPAGYDDVVVVNGKQGVFFVHNHELAGQKPGPDTIELDQEEQDQEEQDQEEREQEDEEFKLWHEEYLRLQTKYPDVLTPVIIGFMLKNAIADVDLNVAQLSEDVAAGFE